MHPHGKFSMGIQIWKSYQQMTCEKKFMLLLHTFRCEAVMFCNFISSLLIICPRWRINMIARYHLTFDEHDIIFISLGKFHDIHYTALIFSNIARKQNQLFEWNFWQTITISSSLLNFFLLNLISISKQIWQYFMIWSTSAFYQNP